MAIDEKLAPTKNIPMMSGSELRALVELMISENEKIEGNQMSAADWLFELGAYLADDAQNKKLPDVELDLQEVIPEL
ncbi:hypothetical protein [Candidatus Lokiarchaeum ossiferum]|uniref:hypothetical protein n=1 Tax=Candidatus Lokiarchaeum ossiferum TaxID=2951803 RepID=UPI00352CB235